jgi:hypothetical protein
MSVERPVCGGMFRTEISVRVALKMRADGAKMQLVTLN